MGVCDVPPDRICLKVCMSWKMREAYESIPLLAVSPSFPIDPPVPEHTSSSLESASETRCKHLNGTCIVAWLSRLDWLAVCAFYVAYQTG
jgi:hypothetical protein